VRDLEQIYKKEINNNADYLYKKKEHFTVFVPSEIQIINIHALVAFKMSSQIFTPKKIHSR
jgi:hypothetical protein